MWSEIPSLLDRRFLGLCTLNISFEENFFIKKTIALIISVILVVALFASCTPEDIEVIATIDEETDVTEIEDTYDADFDDIGKENLAAGFYIEGNPHISSHLYHCLMEIWKTMTKKTQKNHLNNQCRTN